MMGLRRLSWEIPMKKKNEPKLMSSEKHWMKKRMRKKQKPLNIFWFSLESLNQMDQINGIRSEKKKFELGFGETR